MENTSLNFLRTTVLEKLVYILVTMNVTPILHLGGGKVTLQAWRAVNQSKKPANGRDRRKFPRWCFFFFFFSFATVAKSKMNKRETLELKLLLIVT
jgi:hypothetical protein